VRMIMDTLTDEFRAGLASGTLLIQKCDSCGKLNMYPKYACPFCQSEELGWADADGGGILHSFTIMRLGAPIGFEEDLPYALGIVKLDEGVQLLGRLVPGEDGSWEHYELDARLEFAPEIATRPSARPIAWFRAQEA